MANILYGAPESEYEEKNTLVARLRKEHQVEYSNDFLGFAFELASCRDFSSLPIRRMYDLILYDTKAYGENWIPAVKAEEFKETVVPFFKKVAVPIVILADKDIKEQIPGLVANKGFFYLPRPYTIEEAVEIINSALMGEKPKYGKLK